MGLRGSISENPLLIGLSRGFSFYTTIVAGVNVMGEGSYEEKGE